MARKAKGVRICNHKKCLPDFCVVRARLTCIEKNIREIEQGDAFITFELLDSLWDHDNSIVQQYMNQSNKES